MKVFLNFLIGNSLKRKKATPIQQCGTQLTADKKGKRYYFYCNRSGKYVPKGAGSRQLKLQGSCKIGNACSGYMKAHQDIDSDAVHVEYCSHHHNHEIQLAHLTMDAQLRAKIATKLHEGVSEKKILDEIRDNVTSSIGREHLISIQDIQNIGRQYNVEGVQRHQNDLQSVDIWVEEMRNESYNPILLYKTQGVEQGNDVDNLAKDDVLLCIQTEFQKDMAKKFGNNKVIFIDSTHSTTIYDFLLITVMVVDEFDEGVPIAWAISNREDQSVLIEFFKPLRPRLETSYQNFSCLIVPNKSIIQCTECGVWVYKSCSGLLDTDYDDYFCKNCLKKLISCLYILLI